MPSSCRPGGASHVLLAALSGPLMALRRSNTAFATKRSIFCERHYRNVSNARNPLEGTLRQPCTHGCSPVQSLIKSYRRLAKRGSLSSKHSSREAQIATHFYKT